MDIYGIEYDYDDTDLINKEEFLELLEEWLIHVKLFKYCPKCGEELKTVREGCEYYE